MAASDSHLWGQHLESSARNVFLKGSFIHPLATVPAVTALLQVLLCATTLGFSHTEGTKVPRITMLVKLVYLHICVPSVWNVLPPPLSSLSWQNPINPSNTAHGSSSSGKFPVLTPMLASLDP